MTDQTRRIGQSDFDRVLSVIHAMRAYLADPSVPYADVLELTQEQGDIDAETLRATTLTTEEYVKNELRHAALVVDALSRGKREIPIVDRWASEVCSVIGCPELTEFGFDVCMKHWGEQRGLTTG